MIATVFSLGFLRRAAALSLLLLVLGAAVVGCSGGGAASATDSAPVVVADSGAAAAPAATVAALMTVSADVALPAAPASGAAVVAGQSPVGQTVAGQVNMPAATLSPGEIVAAWEETLTGVYDAVLPSVVYIRVRSVRDGMPDGLREQIPDGFDGFLWGQGSGFVWDDRGHIVTNRHVIDGADGLTVYFSDSTSAQAEVVGADPYSDLAVIKVDPGDVGADGGGVRGAMLGDSDLVRPGHLAVAIGAPFGQEFSMTSGIVSAVGRMVSGSNQFSIPEVIQTDAAVNPGNSGGPLLDRQGRVIGINTSIMSSTGYSSGVGMAVPVNIARRVVPALIADGEFRYSWLGVRISSVDAAYAQLADLPAGTRGVLISDVVDGSPADDAGLRGSDSVLDSEDGQGYPAGGDIIVAVNGEEVADTEELIAYLTYSTSPGDTATFTVLRDGGREQVEVTLAQRPAPGE